MARQTIDIDRSDPEVRRALRYFRAKRLRSAKTRAKRRQRPPPLTTAYDFGSTGQLATADDDCEAWSRI